MNERNVSHTVTITEKPNGRVDAECSHCRMGVDIPPSFGGIPAAAMLRAWIEQHRHEPKAKRQRKSRKSS